MNKFIFYAVRIYYLEINYFYGKTKIFLTSRKSIKVPVEETPIKSL